MKKGLGLVLLLGLAVWPTSAWAVSRFDNTDSQYPFETTVLTANTASVGSFGPGTVIYGFRLVADDAADTCGLYDDDAIDAGGFGTAALQNAQGHFIDELKQDTDERTIDSDWPRPYVLVTDLTVLTNGVCIIYHSPM